MKALSVPTKIIFLIISVKCMNVTNIINNPNPDLVADLEDTFIKLYDENHLRYEISALLNDAHWRRIRCEIASESFLKRISVCDWITIAYSTRICNQVIHFETVDHPSIQTDLLYCEVICLKDTSWEVLKLYFAGGYKCDDDDGDLFMYVLKATVIANEATTGVDDSNSNADPTPSTTSDETFRTAQATNISEPSISVVTELITDSTSSTSSLNFSSPPGSERSQPSFQKLSADFQGYPFSGTLPTANTTSESSVSLERNSSTELTSLPSNHSNSDASLEFNISKFLAASCQNFSINNPNCNTSPANINQLSMSRGQSLSTDFKNGVFSGIPSTGNTPSEQSASSGQTSKADLASGQNLSTNLANDLSFSTPQTLNTSEPSVMPNSSHFNTDLASSVSSNSTSSTANVPSRTAPVQSVSSTTDINSSILMSLIRGLKLARRKIPTVHLVTLAPQAKGTVNIKYSIIGQVARSF